MDYLLVATKRLTVLSSNTRRRSLLTGWALFECLRFNEKQLKGSELPKTTIPLGTKVPSFLVWQLL